MRIRGHIRCALALIIHLYSSEQQHSSRSLRRRDSAPAMFSPNGVIQAERLFRVALFHSLQCICSVCSPDGVNECGADV